MRAEAVQISSAAARPPQAFAAPGAGRFGAPRQPASCCAVPITHGALPAGRAVSERSDNPPDVYRVDEPRCTACGERRPTDRELLERESAWSDSLLTPEQVDQQAQDDAEQQHRSQRNE